MVPNIVEFLKGQLARFGATAAGGTERELREELSAVMYYLGQCTPEGTQFPAGCIVE